MLTIFNRRELLTTISLQQLFNVREALAAAGIASHTRTVGSSAAGWSGRSRGVLGLQTYKIYVHRDDYDRAVRAMQPALRVH